MTNKDIADGLKWLNLQVGQDGDEAVYEAAIAALKQIDELKRLCEKAVEIWEQNHASLGVATEFEATAFWAIRDFIDGDPSELRKLTGEE